MEDAPKNLRPSELHQLSTRIILVSFITNSLFHLEVHIA